MVGITNNRSVQDEKLIEAVFQSHHNPESRVSTGRVYGATATNLIIDARPTTNAVANVAKGAGTENMDYYKEGKKAYLGVDNIHVMRDSLNKVVEALREADALAATVAADELERLNSVGSSFLDRNALRRSGWLRHISAILDGTALIVKNVHINSSHVLIHCSDGWDRTAQLSSLAQLCLDPFYRTIHGFQVLIEKDWVSFGHKFLDRSGHLSSEKFFMASSDTTGGGAEVAQAFLASVQNKIAGQGHLKEISPVFHQFLECVRQIQRQYPQRFEFNGRFLEQIHYHLYSCQFGTFLFNTERERKTADSSGRAPCERTVSVWDYFNSSPEKERIINEDYDPTLDDPKRREVQADMGVLVPNPKDVRFWNELYGRTDEEMNGKIVAADVAGADVIGPVESAQDDPISVSTEVTLSASTPLPGPSSRSTSPLPPTAAAAVGVSSLAQPTSPGLSSSMPELSKPAIHDRTDSFRPFDSTTSAFTLKTNPLSQGSPSASSSTAPGEILPGWASPIRPRGKQVEMLSSGVKSMWGRLSTNATAAFSAVQSAYDGVAKELKGNEGPEQRSGELQDRVGGSFSTRDNGNWTSDYNNTKSSSTAGSIDGDKWKTPAVTSGLASLTLDNPWGTTSNSNTRRSTTTKRNEELFYTQSVWDDEGRHSSGRTPGGSIMAKEGAGLSSVAPSIRPAEPLQDNEESARVPDTARASVLQSGEKGERILGSRSSTNVSLGDKVDSDPLGVGML